MGMCLQAATERAQGMMGEGMSAGEANIQIVLMMGVRIINGRIPKETRKALQDAVRAGRLGHLRKDGLKPEAFFHPNGKWNAMEERERIANKSIDAIRRCFA